MENPTIKIYNLLIEKSFSKEEAASFVEDIERTVEKKFESNAERFATKNDIVDLKDTMHRTINDLFWKIVFTTTTLILGQMGLIFVILKLVGVFD